MRHRNYLAIGGFTLALLSSTVLAGHAFAQKGESMQPISGWSSTSVTNKGNASYCAVARRFDGNVILTLARNMRDETSLALDFDQGGFAKDGSFGISLDPGAGEQRSMTVKPASDKAFVFKLGKDEAFYGALLKTGFLRTEIGEKNYNFNLSDIDSGKEKLTTCLSQIGVPVANAGAASGGDAKFEELSRRLARLESENDRLRKEGSAPQATTLASAAPVMTPELAVPPAQRLALKPLNEALDKTPALPSATMPPVLAAKAPAPVQLAQAPAPAAAAAPKALPLFPSAPVAMKPAAIAAPAPVQVAVNNPPPSAAPLALNAAAASSVAKIDPSVLVSMAEENRKLKAQLEAKSVQPSVEPAALAEMSERLKTLEKENKSLASASGQDTETIARLESENDRLTAALSAVQTAAGDEVSPAAEDPALQDRLATLENENGQYAAKIAAYEDQIAVLEKELAAPKQDDSVDFTAQIAALKQQLAGAKAENDALKADNAANVKSAGLMKGELATLKTQIKDVQAEKEVLAARMEGIQAQASQLAALETVAKTREQEVETLRGTLDDLKQENETLKHATLDDKAKDAEATLNLADTQDKLEKLTLENEGLRTELEQFETAKSDIKALKEANVELASLLDDAEELSAVQTADLSAQQSKIDDLSRKIEDGAQQESAALEDKIKALSEENQSLKDELGVAQIELMSLKQNAGDTVSRDLESALKDVPGQKAAQADKTDEKSSGELSSESSAAEDISAGEDTADVKETAPSLVPDITEGHASADAAPGAEADLAEVPSLREVNSEDESATTEVSSVEAVSVKEPQVAAAVKAPIPTFKPPYRVASSAPVSRPATASSDISQEEPVEETASLEEELNAMETAAGDSAPEAEDLLGVSSQQDDLSAGVSDSSDAALSDAQRQEKALSREMKNNTSEGSAVSAKADSVNPAASAVAEGGAIEEQDLSAPASSSESSSGEGTVLARLSDSGQPLVPADKASPVDTPVSGDKPEAAEKSEKAAASFTPSLPIEKILSAAHIPVEGSVKLLADMSGPRFYAYQWQSQGGLFGSAQQKPIQDDASFDGLVQAYLSKTEGRCKGEFAIDPSSTQEAGGTRIDTYEIACVGGGTDSSASLLFVSQGGTFTVVAHESPTENMSTAMDYRDRLIESLRKS